MVPVGLELGAAPRTPYARHYAIKRMRDPSTAAAIEAAGLDKTFGGRAFALRDVSFRLPWGAALAVFGANGAGKSTLLRTLATLVAPDRGSLRVAGFDRVRQAALIRAAIGYVGHRPLLYEYLTVEENLRFYARLYGVTDLAARVRQVLADVGMELRGTQRLGALSNGMQKRASIARALLHRPPLLLMDEPETGLDVEGRDLLERVVRGVTASGASVVMATHDVSRGLALAQHAVVLDAGRVVLQGETRAMGPADIEARLAHAAGSGG